MLACHIESFDDVWRRRRAAWWPELAGFSGAVGVDVGVKRRLGERGSFG